MQHNTSLMIFSGALLIWISNLAAVVVHAQSQEPLWEQYMGSCEQSGQRFDLSKSNQCLDAAIAEFEKLAGQRPIPRFTSDQHAQAGQIVNDVANLFSMQDIPPNAKILATTASIGKHEAEKNKEIAIYKQDAEKNKQMAIKRLQRIEAAFKRLFGETDFNTKCARTACDDIRYGKKIDTGLPYHPSYHKS